MHFLDRAVFQNAPVDELTQLDTDERQKWLDYKEYIAQKALKRRNPDMPEPEIVSKPGSLWNRDSIRIPLRNFFEYNCAYCGSYCDQERDGEVDHFFPKSLDINAEKIYSLDNFVWSCHSCNNKKRDYFPVLNPCCKNEMDKLIFNPVNGNYDLLDHENQSAENIDKYERTVLKTFINGKEKPKTRKLIYKFMLNIYFPKIKILIELIRKYPEDSNSFELQLEQEENELKEYIQEGPFMMLKKHIFEKYQDTYLISKDFDYFKN